MSVFLLKRLLMLAATLLGASAVVFGVLEVLPGNAAQTLMGPDAAPEAVQALAEQLGLDQPAWQRYLQWLQGLLHGDMGLSYAYSTPVSDLVLERLAVTAPLAVMAICRMFPALVSMSFSLRWRLATASLTSMMTFLTSTTRAP